MGGRSERKHSGKSRIEQNQNKFPPFVFFFKSLADGHEKCFTFSSRSQPSPKRRVKCHQPGTVCQFSWRKIEKIPVRNGDAAGQAVLGHAVFKFASRPFVPVRGKDERGVSVVALLISYSYLTQIIGVLYIISICCCGPIYFKISFGHDLHDSLTEQAW